MSAEPAQPNIYTEVKHDIFRHVQFPVGTVDQKNANEQFRLVINELFVKHKPSEHSFFKTLATMPPHIIKNEGLLNELYFRYQAAMHATRAAVYNAPYLNSPRLRARRIAIILDDDAVDHGKFSNVSQCMDGCMLYLKLFVIFWMFADNVDVLFSIE